MTITIDAKPWPREHEEEVDASCNKGTTASDNEGGARFLSRIKLAVVITRLSLENANTVKKAGV